MNNNYNQQAMFKTNKLRITASSLNLPYLLVYKFFLFKLAQCHLLKGTSSNFEATEHNIYELLYKRIILFLDFVYFSYGNMKFKTTSV